MENLTFSF